MFFEAFTPVSYTHLDVYKRQPLDRVPLVPREPSVGPRDRPRGAALLPVSYTHLGRPENKGL